MTPLSRRHFLVGGAALLSAPLWSGPSHSANPDVVIVGAGAAGIAAAKQLLAAGRSVTVIEASNRIGGRIHTDKAIFGLPYDMGAHWLHNAEINPFVSYGKQNGFSLYEAPGNGALYIGEREATSGEYRAFDAAMAGAYRAIERAGEAGRDVSPGRVIPDLGPWQDLVHLALGPNRLGKDFDHFSCLDWYSGTEGSDWFCKEGYGTLWAHSAADVPVQLSTRAETVKWGGKGVAVETNRGTISAMACIVTVSTGVLAKQAIRFDPALPSEKDEAFNGITMGLYNHIALQFSEDLFGIGDDGYLFYRPEPSERPYPKGMGLLTNVSGSNLSFADVGGGFARELEAAGSDAALDFALSELRKIFGTRVDRTFIKGHVTNWGQNPLTFGSYASAEPGAYPLRAVLREPVGERIWFAGEACHENEWATVAGAHKSGEAVAQKVLEHLKN